VGDLFFTGYALYNLASEKFRAMTEITIAVGSTRKPKLAAVRDALTEIGGLLSSNAQFEIVGLEVESGVTHTPVSRQELMRGARQRAEILIALAAGKSQPRDYFVGLEGGLDAVEENGRRHVFLESWAYVSDGRRGHFGRSGGIAVPESLADEVIVRGTELSVAIDHFAEQTGVRDAQGAWGVLSANKITRQDSFRVALIAAFAPFYNQRFYHRATLRNTNAAR